MERPSTFTSGTPPVELACIIDDDPIVVFTAKKLMQVTGFCQEFLVYNNGKLALDGLTNLLQTGGKLPQVVFVDLNMPVMDGWQFLDEAEALLTSSRMMVYILSSSIDPEDLERAKRYQYLAGYLIKPLTADALAGLPV